jgi:hypothetical protein
MCPLPTSKAHGPDEDSTENSLNGQQSRSEREREGGREMRLRERPGGCRCFRLGIRIARILQPVFVLVSLISRIKLIS